MVAGWPIRCYLPSLEPVGRCGMIQALRRFFEVDRHGTTLARETVAGVTTFVTMAYIMVVNPKILEIAWIPLLLAMAATILSSAFGSVVIGLYAKQPFAIAPYIG